MPSNPYADDGFDDSHIQAAILAEEAADEEASLEALMPEDDLAYLDAELLPDLSHLSPRLLDAMEACDADALRARELTREALGLAKGEAA